MEQVEIPPKALARLPWLADRERVIDEYERGTVSDIATKYNMGKRTVSTVLDYHMIEKRAKGVPPPLREGKANAEIECRTCPEREICYTPGHICICARKEN